jgi:hypothetical protein
MAEHRFTFAPVAHGGQALNGQQQKRYRGFKSPNGCDEMRGIARGERWKMAYLPSDARWPVIDVIGNLNLWCAFDSNGDF